MEKGDNSAAWSRAAKRLGSTLNAVYPVFVPLFQATLCSILNQLRMLWQLQTFTAPQRQSGKNICWQEYFLRERWCHPVSIGLAKLMHIQRIDRILDKGREADNAFIFLPQNIPANLLFTFRMRFDNLHDRTRLRKDNLAGVSSETWLS